MWSQRCGRNSNLLCWQSVLNFISTIQIPLGKLLLKRKPLAAHLGSSSNCPLQRHPAILQTRTIFYDVNGPHWFVSSQWPATHRSLFYLKLQYKIDRPIWDPKIMESIFVRHIMISSPIVTFVSQPQSIRGNNNFSETCLITKSVVVLWMLEESENKSTSTWIGIHLCRCVCLLPVLNLIDWRKPVRIRARNDYVVSISGKFHEGSSKTGRGGIDSKPPYRSVLPYSWVIVCVIKEQTILQEFLVCASTLDLPHQYRHGQRWSEQLCS